MIRGTDDDVRQYARDLIAKLGGYNGGFIAHWYASPQAVNHSVDRVNLMCREFVEFGESFYRRTG